MYAPSGGTEYVVFARMRQTVLAHSGMRQIGTAPSIFGPPWSIGGVVESGLPTHNVRIGRDECEGYSNPFGGIAFSE